MSERYRKRISRREALAWLGVMSSSVAAVGCVYPGAPVETNVAGGDLSWPGLDLPPVAGPGYGKDPVLNPPQSAPWPRTLTADQLDLIAELGDIICPGASAAGVPDVIDEWLSAPYSQQREHRKLIVPGLTWVDRQCSLRFGERFVTLQESRQRQMIEELDVPAAEAPAAMQLPIRFFATLRSLAAGAYFSSPQGIRELGYQGNVPLIGDYPGPSDAAMTHLNDLLDELGLKL